MGNVNIVLLSLAACICLVAARIPSMGLMTAAGTRSNLTDRDFVINLHKGQIIRMPNFVVKIADLSSFPAMAGVDVQTMITRVHLRARKPFIRHFHPRGAEIFQALRGTFRVTFTFEGLQPRVVKNIVFAGQNTLFPVGLVHTTECISKHNCVFQSVFTSADPGLVPV